jgi:glycerol kinase
MSFDVGFFDQFEVGFAMSSTPFTLAIDQGTHATRALVFDHEGRVETSAYRPLALHRLSADMIEQDTEEIRVSLHAVVQEVLENPAVRKRGIAQAGLAMQRSSVAAWDRETGEPLGPMLSWQDRRVAGWLQRFQPEAGQIKDLTVLPLSPHYGAGKLRWLVDNVPAVQQAMTTGRLAYGPLAGFVLFHLLRERLVQVDHADAARTQLWNIDDRDWDPWLLDLFGVPPEPLPHCQPICHHYGQLSAAEIPLMAVNGDQNAAVYGLGNPLPNTGIVNLGTGAFILLPTGVERVRHPALLSGLNNSDALSGEYTLEGTVNGAGSAVSWAMETWQMPDMLAQLPAWLDRPEAPPLFMNTIGGLGSPWWQSGPEPTIVGEGQPWQWAVALIESILFLLQANLDTMMAAGLSAQRLRVGGGLARLDGMCQRMADLTGCVVYRPEETEATARGVAWLAAGRPDHWSEIQQGKTFLPQPNPVLRDRYQQFLVALKAIIE